MIDKLDVRVPRTTDFAGEFKKLYAELRRRHPIQPEPAETRGDIPDPPPPWLREPVRAKDPFRESQYYQGSGDLRPFGHPAILHLHCKYGKGDHKLELVDTGTMTYREMLNEIECVFNVPPRTLQTMRVDMCANVFGRTVQFFWNRVRVRYKRHVARALTTKPAPDPIVVMDLCNSGDIETQYIGRKPNQFRIYYKIAERMRHYRRLQREANDDVELLSFEQLYGYPETAILTRVERQIAAGRIDPRIQSLGRTEKNVVDFDPFDTLELTSAGILA